MKFPPVPDACPRCKLPLSVYDGWHKVATLNLARGTWLCAPCNYLWHEEIRKSPCAAIEVTVRGFILRIALWLSGVPARLKDIARPHVKRNTATSAQQKAS